MNSPLCIWSQYYNTIEPEEAILEFEKDGIHRIELSFEHSSSLLKRDGDVFEIGRKFAEFMSEHGIEAKQGHLAFPTHFVTEPKTIDDLVKEMRLFSAIGIECAVLHCDFMKNIDISYDERRRMNIVRLREIAERIRDIDITVCLENLCSHTMSVEEILEIIEEVGSPKLAICLDTGHLNVSKASSQYDFIKKAGKHLKALHLHDNDGSGDMHILPFSRGKINFTEIVKALKEIDYQGEFNFEIPGESTGPLYLKHAKITYTKAIYEYLISL